jgi:hypothetical protein
MSAPPVGPVAAGAAGGKLAAAPCQSGQNDYNYIYHTFFIFLSQEKVQQA